MKPADTLEKIDTPPIRQEESGLIKFLSGVHREVQNFDMTFEFGVSTVASPPEAIDGSTDAVNHAGFVVLRDNKLVSGRTYCLYTLLQGGALSAYIGVYSGGRIETIRELKPLKDFARGKAALLDWLKALVKASCEKP